MSIGLDRCVELSALTIGSMKHLVEVFHHVLQVLLPNGPVQHDIAIYDAICYAKKVQLMYIISCQADLYGTLAGLIQQGISVFFWSWSLEW